MKIIPLFYLLIVALIMSKGAFSQNADSRLNSLFAEYDEFNIVSYPEGATYEGDHRFDDLLSDQSEEANKKYYNNIREFKTKLENIPYSELNSDNKLNFDLFKRSIDLTLDGEKFNWHYMPIGQQGGIHIGFPQIVNYQPVTTFEEYQKYFKRLRAFSKQVDDVIDNMKKGIASGLMPPGFIIEQTLPQMEGIISDNPEKSVFYSTLSKENKLTPEELESIKNELKDIILNNINPSYKKLHDFVKNEYLPNCRKESGIWSVPGGQERYLSSVNYYTTLSLSADEIHNIGLQEVNRISEEMNRLKESIGFAGTLDEFNTHLKYDPQFYFTEKEDLMNGFRNILSNMDTKLPDLFGRIPEAKYDLFEMEEYRAKSAPAAYYYSAPEDRSRPGYFYVNTYNLSGRPKYTMTALALHEAVPGHHLQISIAQELKDLPKFRREYSVTAFVEGWGLYAEYLGYETGMYEDLYQRYGALTFEMWRACRLVVDTGIHEKRWSREEAYEFMRKHTPNSDHDIKSEIDRYISWPGQALAYKIGELKLKELRKLAETKLGEKFSIKEFHDEVLRNGAIPLPLLEKVINEWIDSKLAG
jgi:prolyl oligopeptidase